MKWNNVKMTKEELKKKQNEYIRLAFEMAKKARVTDENEAKAVYKTETTTDNHSPSQELPAYNSSEPVNKAEIIKATEDIMVEHNDSAEVSQSYSQNAIDDVNDSADSAEVDTAQNYPESGNEYIESHTDEHTLSDQTDADRNYEEVSNYDISVSEDVKTDEINDTDDINDDENYAVSTEELFANIFITEEEAEKKSEIEAAKTVMEAVVPDFENFIQLHNKETKCSCDKCRKAREAARNSNVKGKVGHNHDHQK